MQARVKLQLGPWEGQIVLNNVGEDEEDDVVCARAWAEAGRRGWLPAVPMAAKKATVMERCDQPG